MLSLALAKASSLLKLEKALFSRIFLFLRLWANPSFIFSVYSIPPEVKKWREMKLYNFSLNLQKKISCNLLSRTLNGLIFSFCADTNTCALLNIIIHAKKKRDEERPVFCNEMGLLLCNLFHGILLFAHRFWFSIFRRCLFIIKTEVSWFCSISSVHLRVLALLRVFRDLLW